MYEIKNRKKRKIQGGMAVVINLDEHFFRGIIVRKVQGRHQCFVLLQDFATVIKVNTANLRLILKDDPNAYYLTKTLAFPLNNLDMTKWSLDLKNILKSIDLTKQKFTVYDTDTLKLGVAAVESITHQSQCSQEIYLHWETIMSGYNHEMKDVQNCNTVPDRSSVGTHLLIKNTAMTYPPNDGFHWRQRNAILSLNKEHINMEVRLLVCRRKNCNAQLLKLSKYNN